MAPQKIQPLSANAIAAFRYGISLLEPLLPDLWDKPVQHLGVSRSQLAEFVLGVTPIPPRGKALRYLATALCRIALVSSEGPRREEFFATARALGEDPFRKGSVTAQVWFDHDWPKLAAEQQRETGIAYDDGYGTTINGDDDGDDDLGERWKRGTIYDPRNRKTGPTLPNPAPAGPSRSESGLPAGAGATLKRGVYRDPNAFPGVVVLIAVTSAGILIARHEYPVAHRPRNAVECLEIWLDQVDPVAKP